MQVAKFFVLIELSAAAGCVSYYDMPEPHCETREGRSYNDDKSVATEAECTKIDGIWVKGHEP